MGAIAGIMSETEEIGYIADYPIYGMIANINAFAMGAKMVRPEAKIYLKWSKLRPDIPQPHAEHQDVGFISGRDFIIPDEENSPFGLYDANGSEFAMSVWNWGVFYEKMVRSILNGTWDQQLPKDPNSSINYWWGMSSGMIDIICSKRLPAETVHLIELLKKAICVGELHPFSGTIYAQDKTEHRHMSAEDIITMDWLADHIVGSIPIMDELLDDAKPIVQLQGVERAKGTDGGVST
jgi:basic membrane lipoprotein Med (substrate-binding protein (PBP1-ABC) superfamily)